MEERKPLFHGTNKRHWDELSDTIYMPHYWTDSPLESLDHSLNSSKRHDSRMLVVCIPESSEEYFKLHDRQMTYFPETNAKWYETIKSPWDSVEEKNKTIEVYRENNLDELVKKYFDGQQKEFLKAKSFRDKIKSFS